MQHPTDAATVARFLAALDAPAPFALVAEPSAFQLAQAGRLSRAAVDRLYASILARTCRVCGERFHGPQRTTRRCAECRRTGRRRCSVCRAEFHEPHRHTVRRCEACRRLGRRARPGGAR